MFNRFDRDSPARFIILFLALFAVFYYFNIFFFGITSPGNHFNSFLTNNLNYIQGLRNLLLHSTAQIINWLGYTAITNDFQLLVAGKGVINVVYSCLGLGIMSFFTAFVIAYPKKVKTKLLFLIPGLFCIQLLNVARFVLLALFWDKKKGIILDHHIIFNITIYIIIAISIYFWVRHDDNKPIISAEN
jgi:exosortase/archaeosortase family protein